MTSTTILHSACAALYAALSALIVIQARLSRTGVLLAAACLMTAIWAALVAFMPSDPIAGAAGIADVLRAVVWYIFILHLYRRSVSSRGQLGQAFAMMGLVAVLMIAVTTMLGGANGLAGPGTAKLLVTSARLGFAVCNILLIENLYRNAPDDAKWYIVLPSVALGALFVYDVALSADTVLFRQASLPLFDGRAVATAIVAPLLAIAAARNRAWSVDIHVSRTAVFHTATLVASGIFMLGLAAAGEALRYLGPGWGGVAEISLIFAGLVTIAVLLTSRSARSRLRAVLVDNFFSHRYDYRREWMRCINTLSAADTYVALHARVIRAVAEAVDSPAGVLYLRDESAPLGEGSFLWAGSWHMPTSALPVPAEHRLVTALRGGNWIVETALLPSGNDDPETDPLAGAWLAVPLTHGGHLDGFVLVAPPRASFKLDREVFDLLRILGRQVATYVAERRATEVLVQTRELHDYSKRFAFVAHDIKNVSSQLTLLLSNAETHIANPEFQRDMLTTVRSSVQRIGGLLKRLQAPAGTGARPVIAPIELLEVLVANARHLRGPVVELVHDGGGGSVAMRAAAFDAVVTHLLNNAIEASTPSAAVPVSIQVQHEARRLMMDIVDHGPGMAPEFIRDVLFRPFGSAKSEGSGIGAYQARELLREAGGDLMVLSRVGHGTTMRVLLPLAEIAGAVGRAATVEPASGLPLAEAGAGRS